MPPQMRFNLTWSLVCLTVNSNPSELVDGGQANALMVMQHWITSKELTAVIPTVYLDENIWLQILRYTFTMKKTSADA